MGRVRGKCGKTLGICRAPPAPGIGPSRSAPPAPPCARHPRGKSPIAWFTLLQSVPNILPPEPIINKESSIGIGSTSLPSLRNYAALSRSFLGQIRFQNRPRALPRRRGNVVTPAWQRYYAGMATLLRRHSNVVMPAWQPEKRHVRTGSSLYVLDSWGIRTAFQNVKRVKLSPACAARCLCQNERLLKVQG